MSISLYKIRDKYNNATHKSFLLDNDSDFDDLPGLEECAVGSIAESIESGTKWIIGTDGQWVEYVGGGGTYVEY